jgi:hypothetical protein
LGNDPVTAVRLRSAVAYGSFADLQAVDRLPFDHVRQNEGVRGASGVRHRGARRYADRLQARGAASLGDKYGLSTRNLGPPFRRRVSLNGHKRIRP